MESFHDPHHLGSSRPRPPVVSPQPGTPVLECNSRLNQQQRLTKVQHCISSLRKAGHVRARARLPRRLAHLPGDRAAVRGRHSSFSTNCASTNKDVRRPRNVGHTFVLLALHLSPSVSVGSAPMLSVHEESHLVVAQPDAAVGDGEGNHVVEEGFALVVPLGRREHVRQHLLQHQPVRRAVECLQSCHNRGQPCSTLSVRAELDRYRLQ